MAPPGQKVMKKGRGAADGERWTFSLDDSRMAAYSYLVYSLART